MSAEYTKFHEEFLPRLREVDPDAASFAEDVFNLVVKRLPSSLDANQPAKEDKDQTDGDRDRGEERPPIERLSGKLDLDLAKQIHDCAGRFLGDDLPLVYLIPASGKKQFDRRIELFREELGSDFQPVERWMVILDQILNERQRLSLKTSMRALVQMGNATFTIPDGRTGSETYPNLGAVRKSNPDEISDLSHSFVARIQRAKPLPLPYPAMPFPWDTTHERNNWNYRVYLIGKKAAEFIFTAISK